MDLFRNVDLSAQIEIGEESTKVVATETEEVDDTSKNRGSGDDGLIEIPDIEKELTEIEEEDDDFEGLQEIDDDKNPPSGKKSGSSSSVYKPLAKALHEEGFLSSFSEEEFDKLVEEFGDDGEALMELHRRTFNEEIEAYKREQEEDYKAFIEAKENGLDLNKWYDIQQNKKVFGSITEAKIEDDEGLQKKLVVTYLKEKGFSQEEIDDTVETYEDTGKLEVRAKHALNKLKEIEAEKEKLLVKEKEQEEISREENRKKTLTNLKTKIEEYKEIVPGLVMNKQTKEKLFNNITKPVKEGPNGEQYNLASAKRMEDPLKYAIIETYLVELGVFDGKFDKLFGKQRTKALTELKSQLSDSKNTAFKSGKSIVEGEEIDSWNF